MPSRILYIIFGLPGSGKTTVAEILMKQLPSDSYVQISPDTIRKELFPIPEYTKEASWKVWEACVQRAQAAMYNEKMIFWDAVFGHEHKRDEVKQMALKWGYEIRFLSISSNDDATIEQRLNTRINGPSDANFEIYKKLKGVFQMPKNTTATISIENKGTLEELYIELSEKIPELF